MSKMIESKKNPKKQLREKDGQIYVLTIVLLLTLVFIMIPRESRIRVPTDTSKVLFSNYETEIPYFVNHALMENNYDYVRNFTTEFILFSKERGIDFDYCIIYSKNSATIYCSLNATLDYANESVQIAPNDAFIAFDAGKVNFINLTIEDKMYSFGMEYPSFKAVFISKQGFQKDVFLYE